MERKEIILPNKRYAKAPEIDVQTKVGLDSTQQLLREGDRSILLDIPTLFQKERNESINYKIYGKFKMIFKNLYSGNTNYDPLLENLYLHGDGSDGNFGGYLPYDEFAFFRRDLTREISTPTDLTSSTQGTYTPNLSAIAPPNLHQNISLLDAPYHNWNIYLSYVYAQDSNYPVTFTNGSLHQTATGNVVGNGIPCEVFDEHTYYKLQCKVEHGIAANEFVLINNVAYTPNSFGDGTYLSEKYVININKSQFTSGTTLSSIITFKRCINKENISGTTCTYYVHKHKTLTNSTDYILDDLGFESPIFKDEKKLLFQNSAGVYDYLVERNRMESVVFDFKEPLVLSGLTNNLDFTPSEVYVTIVFRNGSGFFKYPPKIGYRFNLHDTWVDNQFSGSTANETGISGTSFTKSGFTFTSGNTIPVGTTLVGAFVEYNPITRTERIVSEALHKITNDPAIFDFGQTSGSNYTNSSVANPFGYMYQPHHRVKLRQLSPYLETYNGTNIDNLPDNAEFDTTKNVWTWHDVYDPGFIDDEGNGVDYPFVNGCHYIKNDFNFYLRNEKEFINKVNGPTKFGTNNTDC